MISVFFASLTLLFPSFPNLVLYLSRIVIIVIVISFRSFMYTKKALLRPGRFEVQIEIPLPNSIEQRVSILMVHTKHMFAAGRLQVTDPPPESPAERLLLLEEEEVSTCVPV